MDKETINYYIEEVNDFMKEGKFIQAYQSLQFIRKNIKEDLEKANVLLSQKTGELESGN